MSNNNKPFHFSTRTNKAGPCSAGVRPCHFSQHFDTLEQAEAYERIVESSQKAKRDSKFKLIEEYLMKGEFSKLEQMKPLVWEYLAPEASKVKIYHNGTYITSLDRGGQDPFPSGFWNSHPQLKNIPIHETEIIPVKVRYAIYAEDGTEPLVVKGTARAIRQAYKKMMGTGEYKKLSWQMEEDFENDGVWRSV